MAKTRTNVVGALLGLHAQTSLHPGSGTALGAVDLPVQRERHTQWPTIAGSALKGILRDAYRESVAAQGDLDSLKRYDDEPDRKAERKGRARERADATMKVSVMFGPPTAGSSEFAGAISITDARLLAFPVRSLKGVFAWVTCPSVLDRLKRDAALAHMDVDGEWLEDNSDNALIATHCPCKVDDTHIVLEEFDFTTKEDPNTTKIANWIADRLLPQSANYKGTVDRFKRQFVVLPNDDFTHFARHATEVTARIGLDYETKTVRSGALFYQEFVPAEALFYSVILANNARTRKSGPEATMLLASLRDALPGIIQVGGDETTGKGICAVRITDHKE